MNYLGNYIEDQHTEFCGGSGIGYEMEQLESTIITNTIDSLKCPTFADVVLLSPLEDLRNSDDETADDLLKIAFQNWIGGKCSTALWAAKEFNVRRSYLESLTVCIKLASDWKDWLK